MDTPIAFHNIIITGASSGIGAALAEGYAAPGVVLGLTGRNAERLEQVAKTCRARGAEIVLEVVDVTDAEAMQDWLEKFDNTYPVDLVIANAGISGGTEEGMEPLFQMQQLFRVNVEGVWHSTLPLMERMKQRKRGQVGIVASLAGFRGFPGAPAYCATKAALICWGEALRGLLLPSGVGVSVICPGFVKTPMTEINSYPMPFMVSPEAMAAATIKGLAKNKARICYPFPAFAAMWLLRTLPPGFTDWLFSRLPAKSSGGMTGRKA